MCFSKTNGHKELMTGSSRKTHFLRGLINPQGPGSRLLWLSGGPATGKAVLSSFIINHLVKQGQYCQYFFIRFGDEKKRSLNFLLRSISYQIAQYMQDFSQKLIDLADEAIDFETADAKTLWDLVFKSLLFTIEHRSPIYWVIDGLDEADDPRTIIRVLSNLSSSRTPIRVLFASRRTSEVQDFLQKVSASTFLCEVSVEGHTNDLRPYIRNELSIWGSKVFKDEIEERLLARTNDNFLVSTCT